LTGIGTNFAIIQQLARDEVSWTRQVITSTIYKIEIGDVFFMLTGHENNGQSGYEACTITKIEHFWARYAHILVERMDQAGRTIATTPYWIYTDLLHIPDEYLELSIRATYSNFEFSLQN